VAVGARATLARLQAPSTADRRDREAVFGSWPAGLKAAGLTAQKSGGEPWERCKHGHPLEGDNVVLDGRSGKRKCRTCADARYRAKHNPRGEMRTHCKGGTRSRTTTLASTAAEGSLLPHLQAGPRPGSLAPDGRPATHGLFGELTPVREDDDEERHWGPRPLGRGGECSGGADVQRKPSSYDKLRRAVYRPTAFASSLLKPECVREPPPARCRRP
jgi:hypothetical protein